MKLIQNVRKINSVIIDALQYYIEEIRLKKIVSGYNINGYKRFYLIHIRKTGGTSLNNMFLSLSGEKSTDIYHKLSEMPSHRLLTNGLIFVGWNKRAINKGNYFYGFSHIPLHKLKLPKYTFTIACFRDPVERVISHYNMLIGYRLNKIDHPCMKIEGKWLGHDFNDFLRLIPKKSLLRQIYMFSNNLDINEAVERAKKVSHIFFTDQFQDGISALNAKTGLYLKPIHIRKANYRADIPRDGIEKLRTMLHKEYVFLDRVRSVPLN